MSLSAGMPDRLAPSINCQANNYRGTSCLDEAKLRLKANINNIQKSFSLFLNSQSIPGETFVYHYSLLTIYLALRKIKQAFIHANIATFFNPFHSSITITPMNPNAPNGLELKKKTYVIDFLSINDTIFSVSFILYEQKYAWI